MPFIIWFTKQHWHENKISRPPIVPPLQDASYSLHHPCRFQFFCCYQVKIKITRKVKYETRNIVLLKNWFSFLNTDVPLQLNLNCVKQDNQVIKTFQQFRFRISFSRASEAWREVLMVLVEVIFTLSVPRLLSLKWTATGKAVSENFIKGQKGKICDGGDIRQSYGHEL